MDNAKLPFCYTLIRCGDDGQDFLFKRIREPTTENYEPHVWAMHMDIEDPNPERVLIFVQGNTHPEEIHDKIVKAHAYFARQIQPFLSEE